MKLLETSHFKRQRKKLKNDHEKTSLKEAIVAIKKDTASGKKLKGEFKDLRAYKYTVMGQSRRLIYKIDKESLILFSSGPRGDIYK